MDDNNSQSSSETELQVPFFDDDRPGCSLNPIEISSESECSEDPHEGSSEPKKLNPSSDTALASTSFDRMHTPEVSSMTSSDGSSDTLDSSSGPSKPKKAKSSSDSAIASTSFDRMHTPEPSVTGSIENMETAQCKERFLQAVEVFRSIHKEYLKKMEKYATQLAEHCLQNTDYVRNSSVLTRTNKILMKIKKRKVKNEKNLEELKQNIESITVKEIEPENVDCNIGIIKVCSLNVRGLKGRFEKTRKFSEFIKEHDIACFTETNLYDNDEMEDFEGYTLYRINASETNQRSRGIGIYARNTIKVEQMDGCEYVLWLKIKTVFEPLKTTVMLGAVYIPCVGRMDDYANIMEEFGLEVKSKRSEYKNVILAGDFNCYTGTLKDYTVNDASVDWFIITCKLLKRLSIPLDRSSEDTHTTFAKGKELIKLCKSEHMFILNGRLDSDKGKGEITCRQGKGSVIDYVIATDTCLELFKSFKVKDVTTYEWFSDCHNALIFEIGCNTLQCN